MYARALVEMDIMKGLPDEVFFTNEYDEIVKQTVNMTGNHCDATKVNNWVINQVPARI